MIGDGKGPYPSVIIDGLPKYIRRYLKREFGDLRPYIDIRIKNPISGKVERRPLTFALVAMEILLSLNWRMTDDHEYYSWFPPPDYAIGGKCDQSSLFAVLDKIMDIGRDLRWLAKNDIKSLCESLCELGEKYEQWSGEEVVPPEWEEE
jgi:hypothetical protein